MHAVHSQFTLDARRASCTAGPTRQSKISVEESRYFSLALGETAHNSCINLPLNR